MAYDPQVRAAMASDLAAYIGSKVSARRKELGYTLDTLSGLTGITKAQLINIEHGRADLKLSTLALLRSVLCLNIEISNL